MMGIVYSKIILRNPRLPEVEPVEVQALADSGALFLCISEEVRSQLRLEQVSDQRVTRADGSTRNVPYVGPVEVRFKNRVGFTGAIVIGNQVRVGAIPMEELDLVIIPRTRTLDVNPASPDTPSSIVMQNEADYSVLSN
jgi:clan AA aspartic protease